MRVLIFGASGYIGQRAVVHLLANGHSVTGYVRNEQAAAKVRAHGAAATVSSLDDSEAAKSALLEHDAALWLAQLSLLDEKRLMGEFLNTLHHTNKTFIFVGGASLLSEPTQGEWSENSFAETDSFTPRAALAVRAETESVVRTASQFGVRSMTIRPPLIYGHGGCKVISDLYHSARKTGSVCYVGRGLNMYSASHVDDLAKLLCLALEKGRPGALYQCVSTEQPFRTMAETIAKKLGVGTRSLTVPEAQEVWDRFSGATVFASCSRLRAPVSRAELGWYPTPELSDILEECVHTAYAEESARELPSWIKSTATNGKARPILAAP